MPKLSLCFIFLSHYWPSKNGEKPFTQVKGISCFVLNLVQNQLSSWSLVPPVWVSALCGVHCLQFFQINVNHLWSGREDQVPGSRFCYHLITGETLLYHNTSHYDATVSAHLHWSNSFKQFIIYGDNVKYVVFEKSIHSILSMNCVDFFYIVSSWCIWENALCISPCSP